MMSKSEEHREPPSNTSNLKRNGNSRKSKDGGRKVMKVAEKSIHAGVENSKIAVAEGAKGFGVLSVDGNATSLSTEKLRRPAERAKRKLQRKKRKDEKLVEGAHESKESPALLPPDLIQPQKSREREEIQSPQAIPRSKSSTNISAVTRVGRHVVRQRYIKHKKMAIMDSKALNEILMIKA
ncbi:hypothetical protein MMC28_011716 [Mycoblastus sanguinarius]|nr:hypothetical protein [Mycoblastus sanguinarius]